MTNIHDIARESGYSVGTVSRVLNNNGYVSQQARKVILTVIKNNDYVPNRIARSLSAGKTQTFGVVVPDALQSYYTELVRGAMHKAFEDNYQLLILPSNYLAERERTYLKMLQQRAFDGLIFASHSLPLSEIVAYLNYGQIVICHDPGKIKIPAVYANRRKSYIQAFNWLRSQGKKNVGLIMGRSEKVSFTTHETLIAYQSVFGYLPDDSLVKIGAVSFDDGYRVAPQIAEADAILASSDEVAAGVQQYFYDQQLNGPLLIGQDRQLSGRILKLPTIDHHITTLGEKAIELLISNDDRQIELQSEFLK